MKKLIKQLSATIIIILVVNLTSCALFIPNDRFDGGEFLDDNKMAEIKAEIFSSETAIPTVGESEDKETEGGAQTETPIRNETEIETEKKDVDDEPSETSEVNNGAEETSLGDIEGGEIETEILESNKVYWTKSGTVWHLYSDCSHIKNSSDVIYGSVEEAISSGKIKLCSNCEKRQNP